MSDIKTAKEQKDFIERESLNIFTTLKLAEDALKGHLETIEDRDFTDPLDTGELSDLKITIGNTLYKLEQVKKLQEEIYELLVDRISEKQ